MIPEHTAGMVMDMVTDMDTEDTAIMMKTTKSALGFQNGEKQKLPEYLIVLQELFPSCCFVNL